MRCHSSWVNYGKVNQQILEDATKTWESCKLGTALKNLFNETKEWFVRLNQISLKDSLLVSGAVRSIKDLVTKLALSIRVYGPLHREA